MPPCARPRRGRRRRTSPPRPRARDGRPALLRRRAAVPRAGARPPAAPRGVRARLRCSHRASRSSSSSVRPAQTRTFLAAAQPLRLERGRPCARRDRRREGPGRRSRPVAAAGHETCRGVRDRRSPRLAARPLALAADQRPGRGPRARVRRDREAATTRFTFPSGAAATRSRISPSASTRWPPAWPRPRSASASS